MFNDFFIYKNGLDLKVYDRKCDHANGKLVKKKIKWFALCMNGVLILQKSCITMSILKKPIEHKVNDIGEILFAASKRQPSLPNLGGSKNISITFISHAFILIESEEFRFAMDPWAIDLHLLEGGGWRHNQ